MNFFSEAEYYMLLLFEEIKQQYENENIITCYDLFQKLKHEKKRIWVNIRDRQGVLVNSYFVQDENPNAKFNMWHLIDARWNYFVATDCFERGFYDRYYIVNCMQVIEFQRWHMLCELIAETTIKEREEKRKVEEQKMLFGKQYNMFGGID